MSQYSATPLEVKTTLSGLCVFVWDPCSQSHSMDRDKKYYSTGFFSCSYSSLGFKVLMSFTSGNGDLSGSGSAEKTSPGFFSLIVSSMSSFLNLYQLFLDSLFLYKPRAITSVVIKHSSPAIPEQITENGGWTESRSLCLICALCFAWRTTGRVIKIPVK